MQATAQAIISRIGYMVWHTADVIRKVGGKRTDICAEGRQTGCTPPNLYLLGKNMGLLYRCTGGFFSAVVLSFCTTALPGQSAGSPNDEILKLVQSGMPESVVVNKIHVLAGSLNTSADALIVLKK